MSFILKTMPKSSKRKFILDFVMFLLWLSGGFGSLFIIGLIIRCNLP